MSAPLRSVITPEALATRVLMKGWSSRKANHQNAAMRALTTVTRTQRQRSTPHAFSRAPAHKSLPHFLCVEHAVSTPTKRKLALRRAKLLKTTRHAAPPPTRDPARP